MGLFSILGDPRNAPWDEVVVGIGVGQAERMIFVTGPCEKGRHRSGRLDDSGLAPKAVQC